MSEVVEKAIEDKGPCEPAIRELQDRIVVLERAAAEREDRLRALYDVVDREWDSSIVYFVRETLRVMRRESPERDPIVVGLATALEALARCSLPADVRLRVLAAIERLEDAE